MEFVPRSWISMADMAWSWHDHDKAYLRFSKIMASLSCNRRVVIGGPHKTSYPKAFVASFNSTRIVYILAKLVRILTVQLSVCWSLLKHFFNRNRVSWTDICCKPNCCRLWWRKWRMLRHETASERKSKFGGNLDNWTSVSSCAQFFNRSPQLPDSVQNKSPVRKLP